MEKSNQQPKTECCRGEGEASKGFKAEGAEQPSGSVHREKCGPQVGVTPDLSNSASKQTKDAGGDAVLSAGTQHEPGRKGEDRINLPGSKSVARTEGEARNLGGPEHSRRTNCESQAGKATQRQEERPEGEPEVRSAHSKDTSGASQRENEGADTYTQPAKETSSVGKARKSWLTSLWAIADKAVREPHHRFGDLYRLLNQETLRQCFFQLRKDAASGVDGVTFKEYQENLEANLENLVERLKRQSYRARLVRRRHIPKGNGKTRPLGIPVLEDKLVQVAAAQILIAIYEADFYPCSYGYRPGRGPQDAIRDLTEELRWQKHNFVVEADIKGFFDNIQHEPLLKMLEKRVHDGALIRLIRKWLRAGILEEDGKVIHPELGTPQGGVISPVLANVYLHYVLDEWFEQQVRKGNQGRSRLFRFADDFVACFEYRHEAAAFEKALKTRLAQYGLEVAPEKTKTIRFGQNGGGYNQRFDFLGLEFRWEADRKGIATVKRRTSRKKLRGAVQRFSDWIKINRSVKLRELFKTLRAKYRGYWNYYGVIGNYPSLRDYYDQTVRLLYKWLNRRSQKTSLTWRGIYAALDRHQVSRPRITEERRETQLNCQLAWTFGQTTAINLYGKFYQRARG